jgi:2-methylcitrate dehydratase PrpD
MSATLSERLIDICARPVDANTRMRAARHLLDWLGCALIGSTAPAGRAMIAFTAQTGSGPCFAICSDTRSCEDAAFLNGALGNIFEMDDVHRRSILHAGDVVIPAALAVAQQKDVTADAMLDAIVRGYEAAIRLGIAASHGGYSAWYNSGTCGVFGAAMAVGHMLDLDRVRMADAVGQAGMMASGIWQCRLEPTFSKQLATAHAARSGVTAALLARTGFLGARQVLEGELGFFRTYYPSADVAAVLTGPEDPWKLEEVSFKPWSACRHVHPAIEAALALRSRSPPDRIMQIIIQTYDAAVDFCDNPTPVTDHDARFSLQYCVASAMLRGAPVPEHFSNDARKNASVQALMTLVKITPDDAMTAAFPHAYAASVEVTQSGGAQHRHAVTTAKGDPENPMTEAELDTKFSHLTSIAGIGDETATAIQAAILGLPGQSSLISMNTALVKVSADLLRHYQTREAPE